MSDKDASGGASAPTIDQPAFHRAASLTQLQAANALGLTVAGRKVALFCVEGRIVATNGRCPHAKGPLHEGEVVGTTLTCPWHGYTFDLGSGACEEDDTLHLEFLEVQVEGDDVLVRA
jgi:nitrite reductase/ring-hydroxylating ferredoxin subunit